MAAVPLFQTFSPLLAFFFFLFVASPLLLSLALTENEALLELKNALSNTSALDSWRPDSEPCKQGKQWVGVVCFQGIITSIHLANMGLSGIVNVEVLQNIPGLRSISLINNSFTGSIPEFNQVGALKSIFLQGNHFSGHIPDKFFDKMESLKKVWLSKNAFTGPIPTSLSKLDHLMELHLEHNQFSGTIPDINKPTLTSFNVSDNPMLEGNIPASLLKFDLSAFAGNPGLCGEKIGKECSSNSVSGPLSSEPKMDNEKSKVIGVSLVMILCLLTIVVMVAKKRTGNGFNTLGRDYDDDVVEVCVSTHNTRKSSVHSTRRGESSHRKESQAGKKSGMGDLVVVNEEKGVFGMSDLMKAAAEVLGNGGLGSAYKAVMSDGMAVVVKRMREMNRVGQDGFEAEMRRLGRMQHPNILTPLAFHYRKEEKLLVNEFQAGGSLEFLLHGNRGSCQVELDWPSRLKIIRGIGKGMVYLHEQLPNSDLPHGNLKSSNVLLGPALNPLLADFGFSPLVIPTHASNSMFAYRSPESLQYRHVSSKSDVYCLGILILEIITGKYPSEYNIGKGGTDLVDWVISAISERREADLFDPEISANTDASRTSIEQMLHLGASCAEPNPEQRPGMREAVSSIEEIATAAAHDAAMLRGGWAGENAPGRRSHAENVRALSSRRRESFNDHREGSWSDGDNFGFAIS